MLTKTKALVISYIRYKEHSIIVQLFTRELGMKSYIVNGVRKKTKNNLISFFQPLSLLDLVCYNNTLKDLNRISEVKLSSRYQTLQSDIKKCAIAFFIAELLQKILQPDETNTNLFDFLEESFLLFDKHERDFHRFHIILMNELLPFLGYQEMDSNALLEDLIYKYKELELLKSDLKSLEVLKTVFH